MVAASMSKRSLQWLALIGMSCCAAELLLLGLEPDVGPRDGGTRVTLNVLGECNGACEVLLTPLSAFAGNTQVLPLEVSEDEHAFTMPEMSGAGVLVALPHAPEDVQLFRFAQPLLQQAPHTLEPCCEFPISGGVGLLLSGLGPPPSAHATLRFCGEGHQQEVQAELVASTWQLQATSPAWPRGEPHVVLEISWNGQQFVRYQHGLRFVEEQSFLFDVAYGLSEEYLASPHAPLLPPEPFGDNDSEAEAQTPMTVFEGDGDSAEDTVLVSNGGDAFILARSHDLTQLREDPRLIRDLFALTCAATLGGSLAVRCGAPGAIGFLMGGTLLGPGGLNYVAEIVQAESVASLGVVLMLFCIGLHVSWKDLSRRAALASLLSTAALCGLNVFFATFFAETSAHEALCIGLYAAFASTHMALCGLPSDAGEHGEAAEVLAILIAQDLSLAVLLAAMPVIFRKERLATRHSMDHAASPIPMSHLVLMAVAAYVAVALVTLGFRRSVRHRLQAMTSHFHDWLFSLDDEFFALLMLSYAFAASHVTDVLGLSLEFGGFLAGLLLSTWSRDLAMRAVKLLGSVKHIFAALFFASIGLVVNPHFLFDNLGAVLSVVGFIFVMKVFTGFLSLWILAPPVRNSAFRCMRIACMLAHVSEFGYVLAAKGAGWGILSRHVYLLLVGANTVSLCSAPCVSAVLEFVLPWDNEGEAGRLPKP